MEQFAGTSAIDSVRRAIAVGKDAFGADWRPSRLAIAPGRIELLGNHLDYNGGPVLAAAIDRFIAVALAAESGPEKTVRIVAADAPPQDVALLEPESLAGWRNASPPPTSVDYVRGLVAALQEPNHGSSSALVDLPASIAIAGDIPIGFGVSSSAALCVALTLALAEKPLSPRDVVLLAQEAEHRAGTPCGTMDQSASVAGGVIAFDAATLGVEPLAPDLGDLVFVVAGSGVERSLSTSSYPTRVSESREALALALAALGGDIPNLASLTIVQLARLDELGALPHPLDMRVRHVVEETARMRAGQNAMEEGDWRRFGELMTASGRSSATLYEISHPDVEELVAEALQADGVLGARMMGGGEGGTALILLRRPAVPLLESTLRSGFYRRHGLAQRQELLHVCAFAPGATLISGSAIPNLL